jgi:FixJ family two-component response regulator
MSLTPSVLILDDNESILKTLARDFRRAGWKVHTGTEPLADPKGYALVDCVLSDNSMPNGGGERVIRESSAPVVIYSGDESVDHRHFVRKPAATDELIEALLQAMTEQRSLRGEAGAVA